MPFPIAAAAIGTVARTAAGVALRGTARGAMTGARFGVRGAATASRGAVLGQSLSSAQFSSQQPAPTVTDPGTAVTEPLRFGAQMRVGTE